jgi:hypothetical protein
MAAVAVVSNHMSWADILIQMSQYFPAFVAREGTQNLPMIGLVRSVLGSRSSGPAVGAAAAAAAAGQQQEQQWGKERQQQQQQQQEQRWP